ncbi:MAG: isomerase [SAR86 cluster bacterium]|uniref:Isomerase n=1 Tax=SAR86 cluster bacterium TaxID=2030880 RepID=A0A2A5CHQ0_9GAMM|nr:PhzF family phenazine biosynthesis protein [bacterium AH-315-I11]PCJ43399.1 MAG: isomerase [SAR86 cluster bacterium]
MKLKIFQIDAFADKAFAGNPAAVVPLKKWLDAAVMQSIAAENNLAETAFFVPADGEFQLRWFTPKVEVKLCGHATLATSFVLFNELGYDKDEIIFNTLSGKLMVTKNVDLLTLNFPSQKPEPCELLPSLEKALGRKPLACLKNVDYVLVFENEDVIKNISPNHDLIRKIDTRGIIVTAPALEYDFVARFFAAASGIDEDPVTGSAYTKLVPYWAEKLGKTSFKARQVSQRGGNLMLELKGDRVLISGNAVKYLEGTIDIPVNH